MFIKHDDILRPHLSDQPLANRRKELQVKVVPERVLLQKRVHPGKGEGIDMILMVDAWDQESSIPWSVNGFDGELAERIPTGSGGILVHPIHEANITNRPCGGVE